MATKTYALLDLVGITDAIHNGQGKDLLEKFWSVADAWTNAQSNPVVSVPGKAYKISPLAYVSTFSDSALLHTDEELLIDDFYEIVRRFKSAVERQACQSYVVISRNKEIRQSTMPALGGNLMTSGGVPVYTRVAGSGDAWVNLHLGDLTIKKKKAWHGKYSVYCVGDESRPTRMEPKDFVKCDGFAGPTTVYAME